LHYRFLTACGQLKTNNYFFLPLSSACTTVPALHAGKTGGASTMATKTSFPCHCLRLALSLQGNTDKTMTIEIEKKRLLDRGDVFYGHDIKLM